VQPERRSVLQPESRFVLDRVQHSVLSLAIPPTLLAAETVAIPALARPSACRRHSETRVHAERKIDRSPAAARKPQRAKYLFRLQQNRAWNRAQQARFPAIAVLRPRPLQPGWMFALRSAAKLVLPAFLEMKTVHFPEAMSERSRTARFFPPQENQAAHLLPEALVPSQAFRVQELSRPPKRQR
jgi:hypothetical protein